MTDNFSLQRISHLKAFIDFVHESNKSLAALTSDQLIKGNEMLDSSLWLDLIYWMALDKKVLQNNTKQKWFRWNNGEWVCIQRTQN